MWAPISHYQIGLAIAIQIANGYRKWGYSCYKIYFCGEWTCGDRAARTGISEYWNRLWYIISHYQIGSAIAIQIAYGEWTRRWSCCKIYLGGKWIRSDRPGRTGIPEYWNCIWILISHYQIGLAISIQIAYSYWNCASSCRKISFGCKWTCCDRPPRTDVLIYGNRVWIKISYC